MEIKHLNYSHSLLSLASSILHYYGVKTNHKTLPIFDTPLAKNYKNVVVMIYDGMGDAILKKHLPDDSFLRKNQIDIVSSVFPPTTAAATISLITGLSPIEHGWLGWNLYFDEIGSNVSVFPNTILGTGGQPAADYNVAMRYIPYTDIFQKIAKSTHGSVKAVSVSPLSHYRSQSVDGICDTVKSLCREPGQKYIYTYWFQPDSDMHDFGIENEKVKADIIEINNAVEKLCSQISDTLVIVTADHGHIDTEWRYIPDYPDITECLSRVPSIESRALSFFIKEGYNSRFEEAFQKHFGEYYLLLTKEQVITEKLFGDGVPHHRSYGFIGDYLAIATGNISLDVVPEEKSNKFKTAHAGLTEDEMLVPFIAVERK